MIENSTDSINVNTFIDFNGKNDGKVGDSKSVDNGLLSSRHFEQGGLTGLSRTQGDRNPYTADGQPNIAPGIDSSASLEAISRQVLLVIAKAEVEMKQANKTYRSAVREARLENAFEQADKMRDKASATRSAALVMGAFQIVGGIANLGCGVAGATNFKGADPYTSMAVGQGLSSASDGIGTMASSTYQQTADLREADIKQLEAFKTHYEHEEQDANERLDLSNRIIEKALDVITKATDQHYSTAQIKA